MALGFDALIDEVQATVGRSSNGLSDARTGYHLNWAQRRIAEAHTFEEMQQRIYNPVLEDCEDAWTASASVTCTADSTYYKRGTYSAKMVIAAAFATGLAAYEDLAAAVNMSEYTHVKFWIRSSVDTAAGDLQLLLDDTSGCVSAIESLNIGALTADTWSEQTLKLATPSSDTAIASVGLNVVTDNGAQDVYIDDIRYVRMTAKDVGLYSFPSRVKDVYSLTLQSGTESRKLCRVHTRNFDELVPRPRENSSDKSAYYVDYGDQFELYPIPDDAYALHLRFSQFPADMSGTTASTLNNKDHILIAGATYTLFKYLHREQEAVYWEQEYTRTLAEAIQGDHSAEDLLQVARGYDTRERDALHAQYWKVPELGRRYRR